LAAEDSSKRKVLRVGHGRDEAGYLRRRGLLDESPFVALFGKRFSRLPLVLDGVIDPETGAHGPDESMHVGVYAKTVEANVHLYAELATLQKP
jgi:hypothetical protein